MSSPTQQFYALHAERERIWAPKQLQKNISQRQNLVQEYEANHHIERICQDTGLLMQIAVPLL